MSGFGQGGFGQSPFGGSPSFHFPNNSNTAGSFPSTPVPQMSTPINASWASNNVPHTPVPFAQNQPQTNPNSMQGPFGSSTMVASQPVVFGSAQSTTAIANSSRSNPNPAANPFANTLQPSHNPFPTSSNQPMTSPFGASHQTAAVPAFAAPSGFAAPTAAAATSGNNPFGVSSSTAHIPNNPFASNNVAAPSVSFAPSASSLQHNPFGGGGDASATTLFSNASAAPPSTNPFQPANSNTWTATAPAFPPTNAPTQNEKKKSRRKTPFGPPGSTDDSDDGMTDEDDAMPGTPAGDNTNDDHAAKLAILKAKIEKKKKKLQEKNQQKQTASGTLNPQANAFQPAAATEPTASSSSNDNPFTQYKGNDTSSEAPTRKHLPADLLQQANSNPTSATSTITTIANTRETLENASSLVGICQTMCPDEEILRRERESDIQLLERIDHNSIHPRDWTLRDTMVKRFRRSAADFKLDVPEWVRPPDVLERVCSYLEEWIMERDRQGPDPRYKHNQNKTPLPLDVYQFIWDRTRMVRKDFTLQNYVGGKTGRCDARAVRCHERMARWHCLCEHQLSHIPEYQSQQSQQNLQELGQTLKSLNQYYDDTLCRSLVEEADEQGNEMRSDAAATRHGCRETAIQGTSPVDYDGTPLKPKASDDCFVGGSTPSHGTAEPEMRGLYILQTMMNEADGGLEITRFAFNLLQNRPEIYNSPPVQLALTIFKTKNANNYAKFFAILRSNSTPYLFSCLMFKLVPQMRREAVKSMARTYGGQRRDGAVVGDSYSLKRFVRLLCFEDEEEAMATLEHYNIKTGLTQGQHVISWKGSSFADPVDPTKGTKLQLFAKKMVKTIERKLDCASRLAICRGQVSGMGATLSSEQVSSLRQRTRGDGIMPTVSQAATSAIRDQVAANVNREREVKAKMELEKRQTAKRKQEEEQLARARAEEKRLDEERAKQNKLEEERMRKAELERTQAESRQKEEEEKRRLEEQKRREKKLREQREKQLKLEEEAAKRAAEEQKLIDEARARELERRRLIQEEDQKKKEREEEESRRAAELRAENERRRKLKEAREASYRQKRLEAARKRREVETEVESAKKKLAWAMIRSKTQCIVQFPSLQRPHSNTSDSTLIADCNQWRELEQLKARSNDELLARTKSFFMTTFGEKLSSNETHWKSLTRPFEQNEGRTFLLKLAIVLPCRRDVYASSLVKSWIHTRLSLDETLQVGSTRFCFVLNEAKEVQCDGAILILPPVGSQIRQDDALYNFEQMDRALPAGIPKTSLSMITAKDFEDRDQSATANRETDKWISIDDYNIDSFDAGLELSLTRLASEMKNYVPFEVERLRSSRLFFECARRAIWLQEALTVRDDTCHLIEREIRRATRRIEIACSDIKTWPGEVLLGSQGSPPYFATGDLPLDWAKRSNRLSTEPSLMALLVVLRSSPLPKSIFLLLDDAPAKMKATCLQLLEQRQFRPALELALAWQFQTRHDGVDNYIYAPLGTFELILDQIKSDRDEGPQYHRLLTLTSTLDVESPVEHERKLPNRIPNDEITIEQSPPELSLPCRNSKRPGNSLGRPKKVSRTVAQSRQFTERLEALAAGDTVNMVLGDNANNMTTLRASLSGARLP